MQWEKIAEQQLDDRTVCLTYLGDMNGYPVIHTVTKYRNFNRTYSVSNALTVLPKSAVK